VSVRPVGFHPDGSIDVVFDDRGHTGTIAPANIAHITRPDNSVDPFAVVLNCPDGCGGSSTHPIGGGGDAPRVQELFVRLAVRIGCPCGQLTPGKPIALAAAHIKMHAERFDGVGRWQVGTLAP
jgi:hypothetical protein